MSGGELTELPKGWTWITLGQVIESIEAGKSFKCEERPPQGDEVGVIKVSAVTWGEFDESESKTCMDPDRIEPRFLIQTGDFLFSRANTLSLVGSCVIVRSVSKRLMLSDKILRLRLSGINAKWVLYALRTQHGRQEIERLATGNQESMRNIGQDRIRQIRIPIAPPEEQTRTIEELEKQTTRLDAGTALLEGTRNNLKRYRASVLKTALEGRLVANEAVLAQQEGRDYETASDLLARIRKKRQEHGETSHRAKPSRVPPLHKNTPEHTKYPPPLTRERPSKKLPEGWAWAFWDEVGFSQNGRLFPSSDYQATGIRLLRPGNLHSSGAVTWTEENTRCLPERYAEDFPDYIIRPGELVINLTAQSLKDQFLGRVCMTSDSAPCMLNQRIARLTPVEVSPRFLFWVFKSPLFRTFVDELNTGSLIQHIFTSQLAAFAFPLPPTSEQSRIVAEIERRMSLAEQTEAQLALSMTRASALTQSLLDRAFKGRLSLQDQNDEPVEKLLERLSQHRGESNTPSKRSRIKRTQGERP